jgi:hypothetical protein
MRHGLSVLPLIASLGLLVSACGGGGGGGSNPPPIPNAAVGGIWAGTVTVAGQGTLDLVGLVAEDGRGHFIQEDGVQYWGTVTSSGNQISASISGAVQVGDQFPDGSTSGTGSIIGTIAARSTITGTSTFTTTGGSKTSGTISLIYDSLYDRDSSLATIAGNYTNAFFPGSDALNVSSSGVIFGQEPETGCVVNGQVKTINTAYNTYDVEYTYSSCTGVNSILNGSTFSGIGTLDNTVSPEIAIAGAQGRVGGVLYSFIFAYQRT